MSDEDRENPLKLRGLTIEVQRRPMTEAEEALIEAALQMSGFFTDITGRDAYFAAKLDVQKERTRPEDVAALISAREELDRVMERVNSLRKRIAPEILEEEYKKRGWRYY